MSLATLQNVWLFYYSHLGALPMVFLSLVLYHWPQWSSFHTWYFLLSLLVFILTFLKAVVLILKHATSLRVSMLPGPALIQADLDYHTADVNKKIQQHIVASQGHDVELDRAFIMAIEMVCLFCVCSNHTKLYFLLQV